MNIFDKEFEIDYPEIFEKFKITTTKNDRGEKVFEIFTIPTQHFYVHSLNELTEEKLLKHIDTDNWFNENLFERKINGLRKVKLEKILNEENNNLEICQK